MFKIIFGFLRGLNLWPLAELATQRVDSGSAPFGQMSIFPKDIFRTLLSRRKCDLVIKLTSLYVCRLNASALAMLVANVVTDMVAAKLATGVGAAEYTTKLLWQLMH